MVDALQLPDALDFALSRTLSRNGVDWFPARDAKGVIERQSDLALERRRMGAFIFSRLAGKPWDCPWHCRKLRDGMGNIAGFFAGAIAFRSQKN
jgi:hypothetical protein